jgi:cytochrome c oxidase subunit 2
VSKWWSVLFGVVMTAAAGLFVVAPFVHGWWLPRQVSTHAPATDRLFYTILGITGFFFILTEALLVVFLWQYAHRPGGHAHVFGHHATAEKGALWTTFFKHLFRPVSALLHDQHRVELAWTLVPAIILLYIAFDQVETWAVVKYRSRMPTLDTRGGPDNRVPLQIEISARQFEWRMRYPSPERWVSWAKDPKLARDFATTPHEDDVHVVNELHVWSNKKSADADSDRADDFPAFVVQLRTIDILHSFNIPNMRVKQDSLPGKIIPVWFRPTRYNTHYDKKAGRWRDGYNAKGEKEKDQIWEIPCAELCGRDHSRMIGRVYVHPSLADWERWLQATYEQQTSHKRESTSRR